MHPFRQYILQYHYISEPEWKIIKATLTQKHYKKGTTLLEYGKICRKLYFLEEGFLRFYVSKDGQDVSKFFTEAPYCFTSQRSFANDLPSEDTIEVLQDAVVWEMSKQNAFDLLKYFNWSEFVRKLIQEVQFRTEQILEDIQNNTAEERYLKMMEENDSIIKKAPLKDIASYLGIAPQSLSRIRKKYWLNNQKLT